MTKRSCAAVLVLILSTLPQATAADRYTRFLLPIYDPGAEIRGAYGVVWQTELVARNTGEEEVILGPCAPGFPENPASACLPTYRAIPARAAVRNPRVGWTTAGVNGRLVWVRGGEADLVHFDLTLLRNGESVAKLPVVRDRDFTTARLHLLNVPLSTFSRSALRVYGLNNEAGTKALVRLLSVPSTSPFMPRVIAETSVLLEPSIFVDPAGLPYAPSFVTLQLNTLPTAHDETPVLVEVSAVDGTTPLWAFVTTTDNITQSVLITVPR